jgi:hypothetical protein
MIPCVLALRGGDPTGGPLKSEVDKPILGFQPTIAPSSVAKRKAAEADAWSPFRSTPEISNTPGA